jgi:hypothetical protein
MANVKISTGRGATKYIKASGAGSDADPHIIETSGAGGGGGGDASAANQTTLNTYTGALTETAPGTDTASSGLNGRLQRIAQRLTSLIALHPASLGQKAKTASFAVTLASDEDLLALNGAVNETAPATDTASSGLNGRLQRIAQRITSLIALVPTSLGQKTKANSFAVTLASDQDALAIASIAAGDNNIGNVDIVTLPALVAGTAAIGKLAANSGVDIGDVDVTSISAGENHIGEVGTGDAVIELVFSLDTSAYAANDVLADTQALTSVGRKNAGIIVLQSFTLIDIDDQKQPLTVVFLDTNNSLGTENSAASINDANGAKVVGWFKVLTSDYLDLGGASVACVRGIGLEMACAAATTTLYVGLISDGTGTYTASGLTGKFGFLRS